MKLNKKIIIPAFTLLVGTALAGSVSSTVAWYQYSTKANVAYLGASAGTSGNLYVRINKGGTQTDAEDWDTQIKYEDVSTFLNNKKLTPITSGAMGRDAKFDKLYSNPVTGNGPLNTWNEAKVAYYVQIPLQFKFLEKDGSLDSQNSEIEKLVAKDLFVSDLLIQSDYQNTKRDLSGAIRVHFDGYQTDADASGHLYHLASKEGGATLTHGQLDLNGDGELDKSYSDAEKAAMYGFGDSSFIENAGSVIDYGYVQGLVDNQQVSYAASGNDSIVNQKLGTTCDQEGKFLNVLVTIWIEGWHQLPVASDSDTNKSSMWDLVSTVNSRFDVGMQFEAKDIQ